MLLRVAAVAVLLLGAGTASAQDNVHWPRHHAAPPLSQTVPGALAPPPSPVAQRKAAEHTTGEVTDDDIVPGYEYDHHGFEATVGSDGRVHVRDKMPVRGDGFVTPIFVAVFGGFDVTDGVMRAVGADPYHYEKARFFERTFDARARLRERHDRIVMARAIRRLPGYLGAVWGYRGWDPNLRKRVLFALWDECAEGGNDFLRRSGAEARAVIESYIRRELPADGPDRFTASEIADLNRIRASEARFDPYGERR